MSEPYNKRKAIPYDARTAGGIQAAVTSVQGCDDVGSDLLDRSLGHVAADAHPHQQQVGGKMLATLLQKEKLPGGLKSEPVEALDVNELVEASARDLADKVGEILGYQKYVTTTDAAIKRRQDQQILNRSLLAAGIRRVFTTESVVKYKARMLRVVEEQEDESWVGYEWEIRDISQYTGEIPERALLLALALKEREPRVVIEVDHLLQELVYMKDPFLVARVGEVRVYIAVWNEKGYTPSYQAVENE